jgi:hypothetical protein
MSKIIKEVLTNSKARNAAILSTVLLAEVIVAKPWAA